ncbi:MAG: laccase domain-containing protein, partial [Porticoccus sp.]|nr:laccase domain-containing protein [Porticoccus sp.]
HAGWRGLAAGVVGNAIKQFSSPPEDLMAYLGPAISQQHFEVGGEDRKELLANAITEKFRDRIKTCFVKSCNGLKSYDAHWMADLYGLAKITLHVEGVTQIYGGNFCTYEDAEKFYSYRREGSTGRMASLIWIS